MNNKAGGPAFPVTVSNQSKKAVAGLNSDEIAAWTSTIYGGMTLRDYFAAKALPALVSQELSLETIAREAYRFADLLLSERAK